MLAEKAASEAALRREAAELLRGRIIYMYVYVYAYIYIYVYIYIDRSVYGERERWH